MRIQLNPLVTALLCVAGLCVAWAQDEPRQSPTSSPIHHGANKSLGGNPDRTITPDDRLSLIAAALDSKLRLHSERDCSHLVHAVYERAGFSYDYASSSDLYIGIEGFQRVALPQTGDLVVWRGHVGIVIRPSHHVFFSFLHGGPGIDDYEAPYWTSRGHPRFYRYAKNSPHARSVHLGRSD